MAPKIQKADTNGTLAALQDIFSKMKAQAAAGEIDSGLIDQGNAILSVNATPAPPAPDLTADAADTAEAPVEAAEDNPEEPEMPELDKASEPSEEDEAGMYASVSDEPEAEAEQPVPPMPAAQRNFGKKEVRTMTQPVRKASDGPTSGRPPVNQFTPPNMIFDHQEDMRAQLPAFQKALMGGSIRMAQKVANDNQAAFDTMLNMSMTQILNEGGCTWRNMSKMGGFSEYDAQDPAALKKAFTSSSVPGVYLIKLAKLLLPVYAGLVNRIPSQSPQAMASNQATWKAQLGFGSIDEAAGFRIATEGAVGAVPPTSFLTFNAPFADLSYNDSVTLKGIAAGRGYSDPLQLSVIKTMAALLRLQEKTLLGQNYAAIDAVTSLTTASGSTTGGTIAAGSYVVGVTALTYEGWLTPSVGGASAVGESTAVYSSEIVTTGSTSSINMTWPAVPGAVAYNVYITLTGGAGSAARYNKTVLINKATVTAASTATTTPPAADTTVNAYGKEGILSWCERATVYGNAIPNKLTITDNAGAGLTAANGGISQFDSILSSMWTTWNTCPSVLLMSPNMNATLVGKLMSLNNSALYRIEVGSERGTISGGAMVTGYVNKFAPFADGTPRYIDVIPHPYMPDGTIAFLSERTPYPMSQESRGFVRDVLIPYTYFPLASTSAVYPYMLTTSETLECFAPSPQTALVGVDYSA